LCIPASVTIKEFSGLPNRTTALALYGVKFPADIKHRGEVYFESLILIEAVLC
jgi:hypothetical protein